MGDKDKEDLPLHDEAVAREKWRGKGTLPAGGTDRSDLPASETDNARSRPADEGLRSSPGTFAPPD